MKKDQKIKPLSSWEWDLTWSSLRYFCGRYSIASAMYPSDLARNFGKRLSDDQKEQLSQEIQKQIEDAIRLQDNMWLTTDMENWSALRNYFDKSTWMELECEGEDIKKTSIVAFPCEYKDLDTMVTKWIPVDNYENTGSTKTMINEDYIKQIKQYEPK